MSPTPTPTLNPSPSPLYRLPLSLRLRIWRTTWEVRRVRLVHTVRRLRPHDRDGPAIRITTAATPPAPASLHVDRESRRETLRHYEAAFAVQGGFSHVWFNYDLDVLELPPARAFGDGNSLMRFRDFARLRKVSLSGDILDHRRGLLDGDRDCGPDDVVGERHASSSSSSTAEEWFVPATSCATRNPSLMTLLMPNLREIWLGDTLVWSGPGAWPLFSMAY
ncbi:hypothetical protein SLS62_011184 [Diatrype stigma]|uniref:2EXR domain-containing protein n=1 Tax=Diatrype stigma TaxID=117547 RepID=A0AAN9U5A3_9PEZI